MQMISTYHEEDQTTSRSVNGQRQEWQRK